MAELPKPQDQTNFPIMKSASLDASNNKILFRTAPESRVRGLPIQSLSIAIDFASTELPTTPETSEAKINQPTMENVQFTMSSDKTSLPELEEEKANCTNMNVGACEKSKKNEDSSPFDVNSQIIPTDDVCEDLKNANSLRSISSLNNFIDETSLKSQLTEAFNFQQELENWRKGEIAFPFSENFERASSNCSCEDKCNKQTDTSDLFDVFREQTSPKLPKWMNKMPTFKNVSGQGKIRRPSIPNISRHLMTLSEKDCNKCSCRSLENQVIFKKDKENDSTQQILDAGKHETTNSAKEERVLQKISSDACTCNEFEMIPLSRKSTESSSGQVQATDNPSNLTQIILQHSSSNGEKGEEVLKKNASNCSGSGSQTNTLSPKASKSTINNMQTINNASNFSRILSHKCLICNDMILNKCSSCSCNNFEESTEDLVGIAVNRSHDSVDSSNSSLITPKDGHLTSDNEDQEMKKCATKSCNNFGMRTAPQDFTENCLNEIQMINSSSMTQTILQNDVLNPENEGVTVNSSASDTCKDLGVESISQKSSENSLNKMQRGFTHIDKPKKKREAVVKPFTMTSSEKLMDLSGTTYKLVKPAKVANEYEKNPQILDEKVHSFTSSSISNGYLITKPVMFYRSNQQPPDKNNVLSVKLCDNCFDHLLNSDPEQNKNSDSETCYSNENATKVLPNNFSVTMYATEHDAVINGSNSMFHTSHMNWKTSESTSGCKSSPNCTEIEKQSSQNGLFQCPHKSTNQTSEPKFLTPSKITTQHSLSLESSGHINKVTSSHALQEIDSEVKILDGIKTLSLETNTTRKKLEEQLLSHQDTDSIDQIAGDNLRPDDCIDSKDFKTACEIIKWHLNHPQSERDESLKAAVLRVQENWFEISGSKRSKPEVVRNFINYFQRISPRLLTFVINSVCPDGNTVLHFAVVNSQFHVIKEVLRIRTCDVDKPNKAGNTPIIISAACHPESEEDTNIIRLLLTQGNINFRSLLRGQTALMMAINLNNMKMVLLLLESGANVNIQDNDGSTALMYACYGGRFDIVMLLIKRPECDFFVTDNDGYSAFDIAMQRNYIEIGLFIYVQMSRDMPPLARQGKTNVALKCKNRNIHHLQKSRNPKYKT